MTLKHIDVLYYKTNNILEVSKNIFYLLQYEKFLFLFRLFIYIRV